MSHRLADIHRRQAVHAKIKNKGQSLLCRLAARVLPPGGFWAEIQGSKAISFIQGTIHHIQLKIKVSSSPYLKSSLQFKFGCVCVFNPKVPLPLLPPNEGFHSNSYSTQYNYSGKVLLTPHSKIPALLSLIPFSPKINSLLITL